MFTSLQCEIGRQIGILITNHRLFWLTSEHKLTTNYSEASVLIVTQAIENMDVSFLPLGVCLSPQRDVRGALAQGLTHTNVIKSSLQGNKGHLVPQNEIYQSNLDYKVSFETANTGQWGGLYLRPLRGASVWACVSICVSGEQVCQSPEGFIFNFWPAAGKSTYTTNFFWLLKPARKKGNDNADFIQKSAELWPCVRAQVLCVKL